MSPRRTASGLSRTRVVSIAVEDTSEPRCQRQQSTSVAKRDGPAIGVRPRNGQFWGLTQNVSARKARRWRYSSRTIPEVALGARDRTRWSGVRSAAWHDNPARSPQRLLPRLLPRHRWAGAVRGRRRPPIPVRPLRPRHRAARLEDPRALPDEDAPPRPRRDVRTTRWCAACTCSVRVRRWPQPAPRPVRPRHRRPVRIDGAPQPRRRHPRRDVHRQQPGRRRSRRRPARLPWSSHRATLGLERAPHWLDRAGCPDCSSGIDRYAHHVDRQAAAIVAARALAA